MSEEQETPQGTGQESTAGEGQGTGSEEGRPPTPDEAAAKLGFKTWGDLEKSYKEGHATITRLSQAKSDLEKRVQEYDSLTLNAMQNPPATDEIGQAVQVEIQKREIAGVLSKVPPGNRAAVQQLMAQELAANPMIGNHPQAVQILFERAQKRAETAKEMFVKDIFGEDATVERIRELVTGKKGEDQQMTGNNQTKSDRLAAAFTPDSGGSGKSTSQKSAEDRWRERQRKAQEEGDVDTVTEFVFRDTSKIMKPPGSPKG